MAGRVTGEFMSIRTAISLSRATLPAFAAEGLFWGAFAAFVPEIKAAIGASDAMFGLILLAAATGAVTAMWLAPRFDARTGRYAMAFAALLLGLSFQAPMWVTALWPFAALLLLAGAAAGLLDVVMNARLSRIESAHNASLMNLNHAVFSFAYAASAIATGLAREAALPPKVVFAALFVLVALLSMRMVQPAPRHDAPKGGPDEVARLPRSVLWGGLIILMAFMAEQAVEGWSALHVERTLLGGAAEGALGPAALGLTMGVGRFSGQLVVTRVSEIRVIFWATLISAIGAGVAAAAPSPVVAYLGFGILGLGLSVIAPMAFAIIGQTTSPEIRAHAISRAAVTGYLGFFIGPPLIGFLAQFLGLRAAFLVVGLGLLLILLWLRPLARADGR